MRFQKRSAMALATALSVVSGAQFIAANDVAAHSYELGAVEIGHLWTKPTSDLAAIAGVYVAILNSGDKPATLSAVTSPAADKAGICTEVDGVVKWLDGLSLDPQSAFALAPWREHICLTDIKAPLVEGESIPLTLDFGDAGVIDVKAIIETNSGH